MSCENKHLHAKVASITVLEETTIDCWVRSVRTLYHRTLVNLASDVESTSGDVGHGETELE